MTSNTNTLERDRGILIVLSGPSGVGKGTVCSALRKMSPELVYSVSATTRKPREGEVEGINYFFKSKDQFEQLIASDEMLEHAEYVGNYYGTPRRFVEETLASGKDVILEIEVQGALKVKEKFPEATFIFLIPPSLAELENRIVTRGTETNDIIRSRMSVAVDEIRLMRHYDYGIVNDEVHKACYKIQSILMAEHCKCDRILPRLEQWIGE
ncbi:guanylate kinase [Paenibacillus chitinolyticus]|uniref:guanylate kinase n=1 Tax=Paenibacillus chitinolyticus TaxID=79263 RepID=UPI001C46CDC9|nr:guanylate kinase [Paenibacillus chitinolyticus]MBV6712838.1 guanylate kinase [Paenibacillus chitinolyticus]